MLKVLELPTEITDVVVHVTVWGAPETEVQVQIEASAPYSVTAPAAPPFTTNPAGKVSVTVIVPEVAAVPPLLTIKV